MNVPVTRSWDKKVLKLNITRPFRWLCLSMVLNNTCWRSQMEFGVPKSQNALPHGFCVGVLKCSITKAIRVLPLDQNTCGNPLSFLGTAPKPEEY